MGNGKTECNRVFGLIPFISFITVFTTFIYAVKVAKIIETNK